MNYPLKKRLVQIRTITLFDGWSGGAVVDFNQLQIFCVSAETLNFTKAAHRLGYASFALKCLHNLCAVLLCRDERVHHFALFR